MGYIDEKCDPDCGLCANKDSAECHDCVRKGGLKNNWVCTPEAYY